METFLLVHLASLSWTLQSSEQIGLKNAAHRDNALLRLSFNAFSDGRHEKHVYTYEIPSFRDSVVARLKHHI